MQYTTETVSLQEDNLNFPKMVAPALIVCYNGRNFKYGGDSPMALAALSRKKKTVDMTQGNITRHIINFALPLLVGNIFQQLYNTVDTWVVGNFVSNEAFSAVGTVGPVINMLIGFFMGLSSGAGVVISQYYGAKRYEDVEKTVHTAVVMTLILGILFTFVGLGMTPLMLELMNTPASATEQYAILVVDLNGLKRVNDTLGHEAGDQMIVALSHILRNSLPRSSVICRWGGDEFTALLTGVSRELLDQHLQVLFANGESYNLDHPELPVHFAVGTALSSEHPGLSKAQLFQQADEDMYRNKQLWYANKRAKQ